MCQAAAESIFYYTKNCEINISTPNYIIISTDILIHFKHLIFTHTIYVSTLHRIIKISIATQLRTSEEKCLLAPYISRIALNHFNISFKKQSVFQIFFCCVWGRIFEVTEPYAQKTGLQ